MRPDTIKLLTSGVPSISRYSMAVAGSKQTGRSVSLFSTHFSAELLLQGITGSNSKYTIAWRGGKCSESFYIQMHASVSRNP